MFTLEQLIKIGGLLQFSLLLASANVPKALNWRENLGRLDPFLRSLFWVYGFFIVMMIIGFGTLSLLNAGALAEGSPLARSLCAFIAIFWLARLITQYAVFDARRFLTTWWLKAGYHSLPLIFAYEAAVFGYSALKR
jgi:hypothetical protein